MKSKLGLAFAFSMVLVLLVVGAVAAIDPVTYTDTSSLTWSDVFSDYWYAPDQDNLTDAGGDWLIKNGDFSNWTSGFPDDWTVWDEGDKAGYEEAHLAQMTMGADNYGMGIFVRNNNYGGSYYAGAYQPLEVESGYYWLTIHATMFGHWTTFDYLGYTFVDGDQWGNAIAWYGISEYTDVNMVDDWRELFITDGFIGFGYPSALPCQNEWEACVTFGRYETVHVDSGDYLHLMAGHKWPAWQQWTVFAFDDIYMTQANDDYRADGWFDDGALFWDESAAR
jgi:hypothetical protein